MSIEPARTASTASPSNGGPGRVATVGCLTSAAGQALWLAQTQGRPAYLTHLLPALLIAGVGVGLTIPSLLGAGSAALPAGRFGTGSGILNMARQVGTVLGVSALVAILATVTRNDPVATWRHALLLTRSTPAPASSAGPSSPDAPARQYPPFLRPASRSLGLRSPTTPQTGHDRLFR